MKHLATKISVSAICLLICFFLFPWREVSGQQGNNSAWSLQFGSAAEDTAASFAVDANGNVYCVGDTLGLIGTATGSGSVFMSKYATNGSLLWVKQFGTTAGDTGTGVSVDTAGNIYIVGGTNGQLFGIAPATDMDSFVAKYDTNGNLVWGKQFRISGIAQATAVAVGGDGSVYVTGSTDSNYGGPNAGLDDPSLAPGSDDIYIMKLSSGGTLLWTKQFGAKGDDDPSAMTLDSSGNIILTGTTYHWLRAGHGGRDIFLAKLTPDGTMIWGSEFGGTLDNFPTSLYVNNTGSIYLATAEGGNQASTGQPIPGLCKLYCFSNTGSQIWSQSFATQVTTDKTEITGISGSGGNIYIGGNTTGNLFGPNAGFQNVFLATLAVGGSTLSYYQFGSDSFDNLCSIATDSVGNLYLSGSTDGNLFGTNLGGNDVFLQKIIGGIKSANLSNDDLKKGLVYTKWNGKPIPLQYPSFHRGLTAYLYSGYLSRAVKGAQGAVCSGKTVTIQGQKMIVSFNLQSNQFHIGNRKYKMSAAPIVKDGHVYLLIDAFQRLYTFPITYDLKKASVDFQVGLYKGNPHKMSAKPVLVAGQCYVPLDVLKAVLPYPVSYEAKAQRVLFDPPQVKQASK